MYQSCVCVCVCVHDVAATCDIEDSAGTFDYYAKLAEELDEKQMTPVEVPDPRFKAYLRYDSAGVAACVTPFNYPMLMAAWKVAPAIAAGCTVVIKPSEYTPLTTMELGGICAR
jgi:betaine-aldehyde dehydrogenase